MFFFKNTKSVKVSKAFTLPEVIVAISVLVLVIVGVTNLLVSVIRNNNENVNTLIAYQLAQEGLEGFRNIRDSNWLLSAKFDGTIGNHQIWGQALSGSPGSTEYYTLDYHHLGYDSGSVQTVSAAEMENYAPWKLVTLPLVNNEPDLEASRLYIHETALANETSQVRYIHNVDPTNKKSIFSRYLKVEALGYDRDGTPDTSKVFGYRVTAVVKWKENSRDKQVLLTTELTDWKGGPL
jgi:prepilin-type N-terminal cleavage/methylation domain-containing protein